MSKFITGKDLEDAIYDIIWETQEVLLIVSPFIKLDDYFKKLFDKHKDNPKIHLILVFGKNEKEVKKSMSKADFDFFKKFLNVSIIYTPNLHAKYYGNESKGVITSINLYDYSFKKNIEFGVFSEQTLLGSFSKSTDSDAWNKCLDIAAQNETIFIRRPAYENKKMIISLGKKYIESKVLLDSTDRFYGPFKSKETSNKKLFDFPEELEFNSDSNSRPQREEIEKEIKIGYCIRTGEEIAFNPKQPMTKSSWKKWNEYKNPDFPEKYCHKTGKLSNGKTSMGSPML